MTTIASACVFVCVPASVAVTVKLVVPATVGVPSITPVPLCKVSPGGSVPVVTLQPTGAVPPLDCNVALYPLLIATAGKVVVMIVNCGGAITMLNAFVAVNAGVLASATCTVKFAVPTAVGVPEITPPLSASPAGKDPALILHVNGDIPPVAVRVVAV